jgi:predicted MFS family arabinose efflux permease
MQGFNAVAFPVFLSNITACISPRFTGLATAIFNGSFTAGAGFGAWFSGKLIPFFGLDWTFYSLGLLCMSLAVPALFFTHVFVKNGAFAENGVLEKTKSPGKPADSVYAAIIRKPVLWLLILVLSANTWVIQSVTVDMPVYLDFLDISKHLVGSLMLASSLVTVLASIIAGAFSDFFASRSGSSVRSRAVILAGGYAFSAAAALLFAIIPGSRFGLLAFFCCMMVFGSSWAAGVFWALPSLLFSKKENLGATAFCSGAANLVNPLAPFITGIVLGSSGYWMAGWLGCAMVSLISLAAGLIVSKQRPASEAGL